MATPCRTPGRKVSLPRLIPAVRKAPSTAINAPYEWLSIQDDEFGSDKTQKNGLFGFLCVCCNTAEREQAGIGSLRRGGTLSEYFSFQRCRSTAKLPHFPRNSSHQENFFANLCPTICPLQHTNTLITTHIHAPPEPIQHIHAKRTFPDSFPYLCTWEAQGTYLSHNRTLLSPTQSVQLRKPPNQGIVLFPSRSRRSGGFLFPLSRLHPL